MRYIGIDFGGTNISAGLVDEDGVILTKATTPTMNGRPYEDIFDDIKILCDKVMEDAGEDISKFVPKAVAEMLKNREERF